MFASAKYNAITSYASFCVSRRLYCFHPGDTFALVPAEIVGGLNEAFARALKGPSAIENIQSLSAVPAPTRLTWLATASLGTSCARSQESEVAVPEF